MTAARERIESRPHDSSDPDPWLAFYCDRALPLDADAKAALVSTSSSPSRQFGLPFIRPLARAAIVAIQVLKVVTPRRWHAPRLLHELVWRSLRRFVQPEANWLILRHFHIGSELLRFIADNFPDLDVATSPLLPRRLDDLRDNLFVKHDVNLFDFVIRFWRAADAHGGELPLPDIDALDFRSITDGDFDIDPMPAGRWNVVDLESAIELYTPLYQLLLTDREFWRATNSLQLDESIAILVGRLIRDGAPAALVSNRHPLVPESTLRAGHRLMLHGLQAEALHGLLVERKRKQQAARTAPPYRTPRRPVSAS